MACSREKLFFQYLERIMKQRMFLIWILPVYMLAQNMLSTIENPVETEFGTYAPIPVTAEPNAPRFELQSDLSNVVNLSDFQLTEEQLMLLKTNHFTVSPVAHPDGQTHYNEIYDIYAEARDRGIPLFITTDALLHGFHLCFDFILKTCEEDRFFKELDGLLTALSAKTREQYNAANDTSVREALFRNLDYLMVASYLLLPKEYTFDPFPGSQFLEEVGLIYHAAGFATSPLFSTPDFTYTEDYSQYKPRGHYTQCDSLSAYFRTMMWLGRMTFSCETQSTYSRSMTLSAILLTQAVSDIELSGTPAFEIWENIYEPTAFFVGKSDDLNFRDYLNIAMEIYGEDFTSWSPDTLAETDRLMDFIEAVADLKNPQIASYIQPSKGFRLMGQRFVPDSWIFQELVELNTPNRFMPTGLDVMAVLGPENRAEKEWAFQYVTEADRLNTAYVSNLNQLKQKFRAFPAETWAQNAYWNWLYCLMPLLCEFGAGYPFFMQTGAWRDRNLFSALASWAELKHDTILYAKQPYPGITIPPKIPLPQGYVEPNPEAFGRIASLAHFMIEGLQSRNLLNDHFMYTLEYFARLARTCKTIAEKELTGQSRSVSEYDTIFEFGKTLFNLITFYSYLDGPSDFNEDDLTPMPVVADVYTDILRNMSILEEGVGYPYTIYVLCDIEGEVVLTQGAGFSYYEFEQPFEAGRLTDEEWRGLLNQSAPALPEWTDHFITGQDTAAKADYYKWERNWNENIQVDMNKNEFETTDTLQITVKAYEHNGAIPSLIIEKPDGSELSLQTSNSGPDSWASTQNLAEWQPGLYYLVATLNNGEYIRRYRCHFSILANSGTDVQRLPGDWHLYPVTPNPFNPETRIRFELPEPAEIRLTIVNLKGQTIRTLWEGIKAGGEHQMIWNGLDERSLSVPSGIYLLKLQSDNRSLNQRMILIR
jgi:hypothetical protein